jgi:hypothetical protein
VGEAAVNTAQHRAVLSDPKGVLSNQTDWVGDELLRQRVMAFS